MSTDTKTEVDQKSIVKFEKIWNNLIVTDQQENKYPFSTCRNRYIVVVGSQRTKNYVVGDIIGRDYYDHPSHHPKREEHKTITYVMVQDDPTCNVCIINLIEIPPLEDFIKRSEKHSKDRLPSPMTEIDKAIYQYATDIDLIILVCEQNNIELMKNMKQWASNRGHIMAIVFVVHPKGNAEQREEFLLTIRNNPEFQRNGLGDFFEKGFFCLSNLSYSHFKNTEEQNLAQSYVKEWRSKFLRACVGSPNDKKYAITVYEDKQSKNAFPCNPS
jgi:hypothetical protein